MDYTVCLNTYTSVIEHCVSTIRTHVTEQVLKTGTLEIIIIMVLEIETFVFRCSDVSRKD